jgi:hypothetical protein
MKNVAASLIALAAAGCSCNCYPTDEKPVHLYPREESILRTDMPDDPGPLQWMGWCVEEKRALSPWLASHGEAAGTVSEHMSQHKYHEAYTVWRQAPQRTLTAVPQKE